jgi:hypothetical protein
MLKLNALVCAKRPTGERVLFPDRRPDSDTIEEAMS